MKRPLILASASSRRQELLESLGIRLEILPSQVDEESLPGESAQGHVLRLARAKGAQIARQRPGQWVLAADTVVEIEGRILGKPRDAREAEGMLRMLSGKEHRVTTGYCLMRSAPFSYREGVVTSRVLFKTLSVEEIRWYVRTGEPFDKAGGYAIQGQAAFMVREIQGSYTNVVGLPLCEVVEDLRALGAVDPFEGK
jgi:septum formation protein